MYDWIQGWLNGINMNIEEVTLGAGACPLRETPGLPDGFDGSGQAVYDIPVPDNEDCSGTMFSDDILDWQGDGYCDDENSEYGINFMCVEFDFDNGDCTGGGGGGGGNDDGPAIGTVDCDGNQIDDEYLVWKGDCGCDDEESEYGINFFCPVFEYDGGDCDIPMRPECDGVNPDKVPNCDNVSCLDSNTCVDQMIAEGWIEDAYCDPSLNCALHNFDGGDCDQSLYTMAPTPVPGPCEAYGCGEYADTCMDEYVGWGWVGDHMCDQPLNCAEFGFDGEDCLGGSDSTSCR